MTQLKLCPLRSSSKGNTTIVFNRTTKILVDCGISGKILEECLSSANLPCSSLDGIVITHEHSDHIKGVGVISRKYNIPVFANALTWQAMESQLGKISLENKRIIDVGREFYIKDIKINSFATLHDAAQSVGYVFESDGEKVAVATDMGRVTEAALAAICGSHTALIEANYDKNMLEIGSYPYELKQRIKSDCGHLCNEDSGCFAKALFETGTKNIILGHLSEENNFPLLALKTVENIVSECRDRVAGFSLSVITREGQLLDGRKTWSTASKHIIKN